MSIEGNTLDYKPFKKALLVGLLDSTPKFEGQAFSDSA